MLLVCLGYMVRLVVLIASQNEIWPKQCKLCGPILPKPLRKQLPAVCSVIERTTFQAQEKKLHRENNNAQHMSVTSPLTVHMPTFFPLTLITYI